LEETANRMSRLNKNLLLLSKIDNKQFSDLDDISVSNLVETLLSNLQPMAEIGAISIQKKINSLTIKANITLVEVLLINLFHNAIRYTTNDGHVVVELIGNKLSISNTGLPLKMDTSQMFERFSKESKNESSSGLGLAIVKRICETMSYTLDYSFVDGVHLFTIVF